MAVMSQENVAADTEAQTVSVKTPLFSRALPAWLQALPLALVFLVFFLIPLALTVMVSFWDYTEYSLVPAFTLRSYAEMFEGC